MYSKRKKGEIDFAVKLNEPLTSSSCAKLITELVKYLLYQKQQIPLSCECLAQLQVKAKPTDRNFPSVRSLLASLRNFSDHLTSQFHLEGCDVREIIVAMGATIVSPKFSVRVELPSTILSSRNHSERQHSSRAPLPNLMRSMIACSEFQEACSEPLGPTNTFILLRKSDANVVSEFFLPKPDYAPPTQVANRFRIRFDDDDDDASTASCDCPEAVKVYHDSSPTRREQEEAPYLWYQSREIIKGFKFLR